MKIQLWLAKRQKTKKGAFLNLIGLRSFYRYAIFMTGFANLESNYTG